MLTKKAVSQFLPRDVQRCCVQAMLMILHKSICYQMMRSVFNGISSTRMRGRLTYNQQQEQDRLGMHSITAFLECQV
jgi:hypothetical protein